MERRTARRDGRLTHAAAGALLVIRLGGCGGGARGGDAGAAGGANGGAGGGSACAVLQPTDPPSLGAALGLVESQLVAAGRRDASFAAIFGADTPAVLAAADALQAQAVE